MFRKQKKGFTLVETCVAIGLAAGLIILVMKLVGIIHGDVAKGTVDLQNLQEARLVINALRRDFVCATPLYDTSEAIDVRDEVRADPVLYANSISGAHKSRPIVVNSHEKAFLSDSKNLVRILYFLGKIV